MKMTAAARTQVVKRWNRKGTPGFASAEMEFDGGLTVIVENGRRRYLQICPGCSKTKQTDNVAVADMIRMHDCLDCRWAEAVAFEEITRRVK